jgi:hypothetical protein
MSVSVGAIQETLIIIIMSTCKNLLLKMSLKVLIWGVKQICLRTQTGILKEVNKTEVKKIVNNTELIMQQRKIKEKKTYKRERG